jgi:hypothetical protein
MPIGLTDRLVSLGSFPILEDVYLQGGLRTVADTTERDAIAASLRKSGMLVWTQAGTTLWQLGPGLTNGDWAVASLGDGSGDVQIDVSQTVDSNSPTTIHTYTDSNDVSRGTICYDLLVTAIGPNGGKYASFKLVAVFERDGSTITEQDVTFLNGPVTSNPAWDVTFNISGLSVNLQVTGETNAGGGLRWRAIGYITIVEAAFP